MRLERNLLLLLCERFGNQKGIKFPRRSDNDVLRGQRWPDPDATDEELDKTVVYAF